MSRFTMQKCSVKFCMWSYGHSYIQFFNSQHTCAQFSTIYIFYMYKCTCFTECTYTYSDTIQIPKNVLCSCLNLKTIYHHKYMYIVHIPPIYIYNVCIGNPLSATLSYVAIFYLYYVHLLQYSSVAIFYISYVHSMQYSSVAISYISYVHSLQYSSVAISYISYVHSSQYSSVAIFYLMSIQIKPTIKFKINCMH